MVRCKYQTNYYNIQSHASELFQCDEDAEGEFCIFHDEHYLKNRTENNIDIINRIDQKIHDSSSNKMPLLFVGYYFPSVALRYEFTEPVYSSNSKFQNTDFSRAVFSNLVSFADATFSNDVSFADATFSNDVSFADATFSNDVSFAEVSLFYDTDFRASKFFESANFSKSIPSFRVLLSPFLLFDEKADRIALIHQSYVILTSIIQIN